MSSRERDSTSRRGGGGGGAGNRSKRSRSVSRSRSRSRSYSSRGGGGGGGHFRNRAEDEERNPHYSNYYRDRFGSESPQEYQNLRVTNIDPKVTNDELREALEKYLGRYGDMNVKIIRQMDPHERIAYVNFERIGDARQSRHGCLQKLVDLLGRRLTVDPAGVLRDQEGRCVKATSSGGSGGRSPPFPPTTNRDSYNSRSGSYRSDRDRDRNYARDDREGDYHQRHHPYQGGGGGGNFRGSRSSSSRDHRDSSSRHHGNDRPPPHRRTNDYSAPPPSGVGGGRGGGGGGDWFPSRVGPPMDESEEEANATRTLFVGNLHADVSRTELQRTFIKFGVIEQVDIKTPHDGGASYAFIRFQNLAMAQEAKHCLIGHCGAWKIGYGKPTPSRRLWVGGLGPNTSLAWLEKEFDRFGAIEKIDYVRGENHAYILFASEEASTEAWRKMKGMQLKDGGERHLLQVDFADSSMYDNGGGGGDDHGQANFNQNASGGRSQVNEREEHNSANDAKTASSQRRPAASPATTKRPTTPTQPPPNVSPPSKPKAPNKGTTTNNSTTRSPRTPPLPLPVLTTTTSVSSPPVSPPSVVQKAGGAGATPGVVVISDGTVSSTTTSPPTSICELSAQNLDELHQLRSPCWTGALVLKKSAYPIRLYKLAGDDDLIDAYLRNERGESVQLTITQRLKLDQPKQDDVQKWLSSPSDQNAFLLASANTNVLATQGNLADLQPRPLKLLVKYFKEKDAAGVVSVVSNRRIVAGPTTPQQQQQNGILYTFPRCPFVDLLTSSLCPKLAVMQRCGDDCLLVVLQKSAA